RRYSTDDLYRIATIRRAKEAGLSLDRIASMINTTDLGRRAELLRRQQDDLRASIETCQRALEMITCALECDHDDFTTCVHYQAAIEAVFGADQARGTSRMVTSPA
ncbi:MAG TPA: MerR family transcriptional regulator, partial [Microlunatus sp.]